MIKKYKKLIIFLSLFGLFFSQTKLTEAIPRDKQLRNRAGQFVLEYKPTRLRSDFKDFSISHQEVKQRLQQNRIFDNIVNELNNSGLVIRQDIPVSFEDCKVPNAYWSPKDSRIIICYNHTAFNVFLFHGLAKIPIEKAWEKSINQTIFTFYHELGHGLIDVLELQAVGQEEDTVDEFAAIMLLQSNQAHLAQTVLDSAHYHGILSYVSNPPPWGEHSPNNKRLFNLVCFVYGSNPQRYEGIFANFLSLVGSDTEIDENKIKRRKLMCRGDYQKKVLSWRKLLIPHYATQNRRPSNTPAGSNSSPSPGTSTRGIIW